VIAVSRAREKLIPWFHLLLPEPDVLEMLVDKARFATWAERQGLPVPRTRRLTTGDDVTAAAPALRFPCILKPAVRTARWKRHTPAKGFRVEDAAALGALFQRHAGWADEMIVQEYVEGGDPQHFTCNCYLTKSGDAAVTFTSRKLRQWPVTAGEACLSEEVRNDTVRDETLRLLRAAGHVGLGYVEFKRDASTGEYLVLEANVGRPTGRSAQAEAAGVELLYTQYCDALGLPLPDAREQRYTGVKWVYLRSDLQSVFHHWRRGTVTLRSLLRSWSGPRAYALFSWSDPVPFWADLAGAAGKLLSRRRDREAATLTDAPVSA
jgi:predicted ATP-grasp superfamily ATP-dependent carboligase